MNRKLSFPNAELAAFCRAHHIRRLAIFGSALRADFGAESDIGIQVEVAPDRVPGSLGLAGVEIELSALFGGRKVGLRTPECPSRNFR